MRLKTDAPKVVDSVADSKKLNIYEKIALVANEIGVVEKNLEVGKGVNAYKAVAESDVLKAVKEAEAKAKIVSIPMQVELISSEIKETIEPNGQKFYLYVDTVKMTIRIYNLERVSETVDITAYGRGIDYGDKGIGKASTYARKYALMNAYKVVTGEDPDADKSNKVEALSKDEMRIAVYNFLQGNNRTYNATLKNFAVETLDELTADQIKVIYDKYRTKL